nr:YcxB family protein [Lachnospiraceae bacterium]
AVIEDNVISVSWDEILMVRETGREIFIFRDKDNAFVLPKKGIEGSLRKIRKFIRDMMHHGDVSLLKR